MPGNRPRAGARYSRRRPGQGLGSGAGRRPQQFYDSDAKELRKVVEIEWVGARPVTIPKKDWCKQWACVTDLVAGGGDLEETGRGGKLRK